MIKRRIMCRVEHALDAVLGFAHQESEITGTGNLLQANPYSERTLRQLPACANDDDYNFLLRTLCDDGYVAEGPFYTDPPTVRVTEQLSSAFVDDNIRAYL